MWVETSLSLERKSKQHWKEPWVCPDCGTKHGYDINICDVCWEEETSS